MLNTCFCSGKRDVQFLNKSPHPSKNADWIFFRFKKEQSKKNETRNVLCLTLMVLKIMSELGVR